MQMRWGSAGDYEAIVVAPSSVQELYDYTIWAFNLAEEYRNPVIVMSETTIALMRERLDIPSADSIKLINRRYTDKSPEDYLPYKAEPNGCPDAAPLGKGYNVIYSINPHDEKGSIDWDPDAFDRLYKRVTGKISENRNRICRTSSIMLDDADYALIAYGSEVRSAVEAAQMARESGIKAGVLKLCNVWPVPEEQIREVAANVRGIFSVEMNIGKYGNEIRRVVDGKCPVRFVTKNRGLVHTPSEILDSLKEGLR
jgi:2-oxoglutarate ferredoxin oxidoreductase subunit alpha